ncbi:GIY-YIG nuclease family protein [Corallococcus sp. M34]|uniref:GIY-YIG nuclease family protein n=1 Tax=Citreicoccus inhibens TaxID=2849499 RepID=UPI0018F697CA|nr:GIY-YIG nuclease family protein [Citreicoccus inhibens]MBU8898414.1 GIY-YIG nuclease family protein [Citreicoccus inhibens]
MASGDDSRAARSEAKRAYKEKPPPMGVYAIRCRVNGKVFVGTSLNVTAFLNRLRFELTQGMHSLAPGLQEDWRTHGADAFSFEVIDTLPPQEEPRANPKEELEVLLALWLDRLRPYGEAGYNTPP